MVRMNISHKTNTRCQKENTIRKSVFLSVVGLAFAAGADVTALKLTGPFGDRLDRMVRNHVEMTDARLLADVFHGRTKAGWWQSEFWGKYMHAAVPFWKYAGSARIKANIDAGIGEVLSAQEPDGYIGNYRPSERHGSGWDVWGMKYTALGLLHYYDGTGDRKALEAAGRLVDCLIGRFGSGGSSAKPLVKTGGWGGLASGSVLEPVVWLYVRTKEPRYLAFADEIVRQLGFDPDGPRLVVQAGTPVADRLAANLPKDMGKDRWYWTRQLTKAYEMMSCYQGLLDYYEVTGRREILEAAVKTAESIATTEINLAGGATARELWYHGAAQQHRNFAWQQETCVVTTWMRLCEKLLTITKDPRWADRMERTFYNAYLAALSPACDRFASYTPLAGYRSVGHQHCDMHTDCCNSNGPRGFLTVLNKFLTARDDTVTFNFYLSADARVRLAGAQEESRFRVFTLYPKSDTVHIWYRSPETRTFTLRLRVPQFSSNTVVRVNGQPVEGAARAGTYLDLRREWKAADGVEIVFDMPVEMHRLDDFVAFTRGPVCLARDTRFGEGSIDEEIEADKVTSEVLAACRVIRPPTTDMFMAVEAVLPAGCHGENPDAGEWPVPMRLTDFASAGNSWQPNDRYRVWLPVLVSIKNEPDALSAAEKQKGEK